MRFCYLTYCNKCVDEANETGYLGIFFDGSCAGFLPLRIWKNDCEVVTDETIENMQQEIDSGDDQHEADSEVVSTRQTR